MPLIAILLFLLNCKKAEIASKMDYNEKANELLQQVIANYSCDCILEIPKKSMIQTTEEERPNLDIRKILIKKLKLTDKYSLDSLNKLSDNFSLDKNFVKQKKLKLIKFEMLTSARKDKDSKLFKTCPNGILSIQKPIFDKYYKTAVINVSHAFTCNGGFIAIYKFKNGKWIAT